MSALLALVHPVYHALNTAASVAPTVAPTPVPTPVPSPSPTVAPVVHHAAAVVVQQSPSLSDMLNNLAKLLTPYLPTIIAGALVLLQNFLNKLPWLQHDIAWVQKSRRLIVALVLPLVASYTLAFSTGVNNVNLAPWVFFIGQVIFGIGQSFSGFKTSMVQARLARQTADGGRGADAPGAQG